MNKRSFNRIKRECNYSQKHKELMMICNFSIPHIRDVIGFRAGQCTFENKILSAILHEYGYQTRIASGEAVLIDNGTLIVDHRDSFDGKSYYYRGKKLSLAKGAGGLPFAHHTWIMSDGNMIDISVGSNIHSQKRCLFGPLVNGLPAMNKSCSLSSMLKEAEKIQPATTAWSYREFDSDEYQINGKILDLHLGHELGEKWLKTTSDEFVKKWLLHDEKQRLVVDEISIRVRNELQEKVDTGNSKLIIFN